MGYAIVARPIDTLFFRDGAPFNAGETGFIKSIFPPTPQTGYGFSRAALLNAFCKRMVEYIKHGCEGCRHRITCEITHTVGNPSSRDGSLHIKGPYIYDNGQRYYPIPLDLSTTNGEADRNFLKESIVPLDPVMTDLGKIRLPRPYTDFSWINDSSNFTISESEFLNYLTNGPVQKGKLRRISGIQGEGAPPFIMEENKVGIALDRSSRSTRESMLYSIQMIRMLNDSSLWIKIGGLSPDVDVPKNPMVLRLGGEGKRVAAKFTESQPFQKPDIVNDLQSSGNLKIVLLQHTDFGGCWHPPGFVRKENNGITEWQGELNGIGLTLVCARINKLVYVGGWDTVKKKPRLLEMMVPAGSVLYFNLIDNNDAKKVIDRIHDKHVGLNTNLGFGHAVVGVWKDE